MVRAACSTTHASSPTAQGFLRSIQRPDRSTTICAGSPTDVPLRDAIAQGRLPGPRILTAIQGLQGRGAQSGTPDEIRDYVRKQKEATADLIKIFASGGMLQGEMTLSQEQLNAACD